MKRKLLAILVLMALLVVPLAACERPEARGGVCEAGVCMSADELLIQTYAGRTGALNVEGGSDITMYSDAGSTQTLLLDGSAGAITASTITVTTWVTQSTDLNLTGSLTVGNGTPTVEQDGEDAYIEGQLEVDGEAQFDGTVDINGAVAIDGGVTNIGGGTPDVADGDNDLYVTGDLEVDGELELDGALDADSTANVQGNLTLQALLLTSFADVTIDEAGEVLTPTKTVYALDSGGAISMTLAAAGADGQLLILIGDDDNNVTVNDTNLRSADGNAIVIAQYEVVVFVYQDSEWLLIADSANQ